MRAFALGRARPTPACKSVCLIVSNTREPLELALLDELAPYCTDEALLYRTPDVQMNTEEWYRLYAIPRRRGSGVVRRAAAENCPDANGQGSFLRAAGSARPRGGAWAQNSSSHTEMLLLSNM